MKLILIRGVPGSGKTTFARTLGITREGFRCLDCHLEQKQIKANQERRDRMCMKCEGSWVVPIFDGEGNEIGEEDCDEC